MHHWIRVAGLRIALLVNSGVNWNPVGDGILRHVALVHLKVRDPARIRRPEVVAANVKLLFVNPIHLAVENSRVVRIGLTAGYPVLLSQLDDADVVVLEKGEQIAVRREFGIVAGSRSAGADIEAGPSLKIVEPETSIAVEQEMRRVRRPKITGHVVAIAVIAIFLGGRVVGQRR